MATSLSDAGLSALGLNAPYDPSQIGGAFQAGSMAPQMASGTVIQGFNDPTTQQTSSVAAILNSLLQGAQAQTDYSISGPGGYNEQLIGQLANYNQQYGELGQQLGFQRQGFGIQGAGLGLQGQSLDQQLANLQKMYGFQQQQFGLQRAGMGIQNQGIAAERNQVAWNANQQGMANQQQSAAAGNFGAKGYYDRAQNLWEQAMYQFGGLDRQQQQLFLQMKGLGVQEQEAAQQNVYSQQQIADARQKLELDYQSLGLSQNEAQAAYQNAINKLGLNNVMTVDQLTGEIAKAKAGMYTPVTQYFGQLVAAGAPIVA